MVVVGGFVVVGGVVVVVGGFVDVEATDKLCELWYSVQMRKNSLTRGPRFSPWVIRNTLKLLRSY